MSIWSEAQKWEGSWWGTCQNTYGEEEKQLLYANRMGLQNFHNGKSPYNFDLQGKSVIDIGGGPCSILIKCVNVVGTVIDPLPLPEWVSERYKLADIKYIRGEGEVCLVNTGHFDEVWIYNVLQHTSDPEAIIKNAKKYGKIIRIFEWVDTVSNEGHPHILTENKLNEWLGGEGKVEMLNGQANCSGRCYYGIFIGNK